MRGEGLIEGYGVRIWFWDEWKAEVVGFDIDDLEFLEGDWEHGEDFIVEEAEVCGD